MPLTLRETFLDDCQRMKQVTVYDDDDDDDDLIHLVKCVTTSINLVTEEHCERLYITENII
jgi:hypothetical protein